METLILSLIVALGIGLLIGAERERRNLERPSPSPLEFMTFPIASLAGALALTVGGVLMVAITMAAAASLTGLSYWRTRSDESPGLTTELALVLTVLLGALAIKEPAAAAAVGVTVTFMLAARKRLGRFVGSTLTEEEVRAGLVLAAAVIVVLPLVPDEQMGPFDALNPRSIWRLVVLVLGIGAAGHVAVRTLGARYGLPIAGLASGFVSSSATLGAMGSRAAKSPAMMSAAVAGAVLSTVATVIQMSAVVAALSPPTLKALAGPLICSGIAAVGYGALFTLRALRAPPEADHDAGEAFSLVTALIFAATLSAVLLLSAALTEWFGEAGAIAGAGLAGFVDAHAAGISIASMAASGKITPDAAVVPILAGFTTNTVTKIVLAVTAGGRKFALFVAPGLVLVAAAAWLGALVVSPLLG